MIEGKTAKEVIGGQGERKEGEDDFRSAKHIPWDKLILTKGLYKEAEVDLACSRDFHWHRKAGFENCWHHVPRLGWRSPVFPEDEVVTFFGGKRALIYHWNENPFLLVGCVKALPPQTWTTLGSLTHPPHLTNIYPATKLLFIKNSFVIVFLIIYAPWRKTIKDL